MRMWSRRNSWTSLCILLRSSWDRWSMMAGSQSTLKEGTSLQALSLKRSFRKPTSSEDRFWPMNILPINTEQSMTASIWEISMNCQIALFNSTPIFNSRRIGTRKQRTPSTMILCSTITANSRSVDYQNWLWGNSSSGSCMQWSMGRRNPSRRCWECSIRK